MKPLFLVTVLLLAGMPPALSAGDGAAGQGIKEDASRAKQGIKSTARSIRESIRNGAENLKRDLAVAQCNDGRYSYTTYSKCDRHGGVRQRFR